MSGLHLVERARDFEPHTDCPACTDELAIAFAAVLPVTGGDRIAAAIIASAAVLGDILQRDRHD